MKKKTLHRFLSLVLAAGMVLSLAACGSGPSGESQQPNNPPSQSGGESSQQPDDSQGSTPTGGSLTEVTELFAHSATVKHDKITVVAGGDPGNLLPQETHVSGKEILDSVFDKLYVIAGFGGELLPLVAAGLPVDNGDGTYSITLRDNVVDSDGNPITASDVVFSYDWLVNNSTPHNMEKYHGAEAVSDYEVRFTCDPLDGVSDLGNLFAQQYIFSEKAFNDHDFATDPVGSGPYKVASFTAGSEVKLTAREDYWCEGQDYQPSRCCANVKEIVYKILNDASQQANSMRTGELDYSNNLSDTDLPDFLEGGQYADKFGAFSYMDNLTYWFSLNCSDSSPCSDVNLRKAIMYAIDASACAAASGNANAELVYDFYNSKYPEVKEAWSTTEDTFYTNPSLDTAKSFLDQSSYKGEELVLVTQDAPPAAQDVATIIANLLQSIGINCKLSIVTAAVWNDVYANDDSFDMLMSMMASDDYGVVAYAQQYLDHGLVYVTCGCRGRESRDKNGRLVGKAPASLVDLKTAIRFLRHNRAVLPGDWDRIISVGWSAGGAMSTLLAVTGDNGRYDPYLRDNGAFMEESDGVFAAQIYCPIIDLEHADMAYEWMFREDKTCEDSPAGPAETMTSFKEALSAKLAVRYVCYFNSLELKDPVTGAPLTLNEDGRSGSGYDYLMDCLNVSATDFLRRLSNGELPQKYSVRDYLTGNYTYLAPAPAPSGPPLPVHQTDSGEAFPDCPPRSMSLGDLVSRPLKGIPFYGFQPPMVECPGNDKRDWLHWNGERAKIAGLDAYVLHHRRRMKPCTSFDKLNMDSGENQMFGSAEADYVHFSQNVAQAIADLKNEYPKEYSQYIGMFQNIECDPELVERLYLTNPLNFIGRGENSSQAAHYRIRVGASDADTSLSVSMVLALKLANAGCGTVDYAMVWEQPHCEADYPGEVLAWIDRICNLRKH